MSANPAGMLKLLLVMPSRPVLLFRARPGQVMHGRAGHDMAMALIRLLAARLCVWPMAGAADWMADKAEAEAEADAEAEGALRLCPCRRA